MEIQTSSNLKKLAKSFEEKGHKLYIVGGYVRNAVLNISSSDIDVCSSMPVESVEEVCAELKFRTQVINKKLGTILISAGKSDKIEQYEYTIFRSENYTDGGEHKPTEVQFVTDAKVDALRRDFTVNALYYDINTGEIVDFCDGLIDINKKVIKTVRSPEIVFNDDGLRILRLVRFLCELNFKPEAKTLKTAKALALNVKDISKERILKEIKLSCDGGLRHGISNHAHKNLVKYYNNLGLWQYAFNSAFNKFKVKTTGKFYNAFIKAGGEFRYIALMCLVLNSFLKTETTDANLTLIVNNMLGIGGLKDSNKNINDVMDAYRFAQFLKYKNIDFLFDNRTCISFEKLPFEIKKYLTVLYTDKVTKIRVNILEMRKRKIPFTIEELKISNSDLIEKIRVNEKNVSKIKNTLYEMCINNKIINDRQILLQQAKFLSEQY